MSRATPQIRNLSQRLMASETKGKKSSEAKGPAVFGVCDQLRPHLATLMGKGGYHALLRRALVMSQTEVAWLRAVQVSPDGSLGLDGQAAEMDPKEVEEGGVVLVAQLLGLLVAFIGEALTLHMVHEVWPKLSFNESDI